MIARSLLILALSALLLWITWPADHDDRLGLAIILPPGIPLWFLLAYWLQALIVAASGILLITSSDP